MTDEQLFDRALQLDASERDDFLDGACETTQQRGRVAALLAAHDQPDSLLDTEAMVPAGDTIVDRPIRKTIGDFEVIRELGRGGMGVVYEARQKSLKRRVALKVLSSGLGLSSKAILRFRREAEAAGKLHHTNIVPIYTTGEDKGIHYYAMELIDGPSLDAVIKDLEQEATEGTEESEPDADVPNWLRKTALYDASGPARARSDSPSVSSSTTVARGSKYFDQVATMIAEVADALEHAHEHGVIHRDIKPSNLLLAPDGRLSVNDFGLARMLEQPGMTMSGEFVGSPLYMSPEQITAGRVTIDHRTDIYSLGATLYELLTLQPPFPGQTRDQVLTQILHKEPPSPRKLNRKVPTDLDTICMKAIEKDPDRRYQSAGQFAKDLRAYVNRHAISVRRVSVLNKSLRWIARHPSQSILGLLLFITLGVVIWKDQIKKAEELKHEQEMYLMSCMTGDFGSAREHLDNAEKLKATEGWLLLAKGQIEMYAGNYDRAFELLRQAPQYDAPKLQTQATLAIARLYSGDERGHERDLRGLLRNLSNKNLDPGSSEDYLYLARAFQYADPKQARTFLSSAKQFGDLYEFVRCNVFTWSAIYEADERMAVRYAETAQAAGASIRKYYETSPFAAYAGIWAETVAAICFRRNGEQDKEAEAINRSRKYAQEAKKHHASKTQQVNYLLLDEFESDNELASQFLKGLGNGKIDYYTRTYRMIDCIRTGDVEQIEFDWNAIERDHKFKYPLVALVRLSSDDSQSNVESIKNEFRIHCRDVLRESEGNVFHEEFFWAAAKILGLSDVVRLCERELELRAANFESFYIRDTRRAVADVSQGQSTDATHHSGEDRRVLSYRLFALGVEALSRGDRENAIIRFDECSRDGNPGFYVSQFARAMSAKLKNDGSWPRSIDPITKYGPGPDYNLDAPSDR